MKTIIVDIDGTICRTEGNDYENSVPIPENIAKINKLFDEGNKIIYWTSRGTSSGISWFALTSMQLEKWGCKYTDLRMDKPSYDLWIDDKSIKLFYIQTVSW